MVVYKFKIAKEDYKNKTKNGYNIIKNDFYYLNIFINQDIKNLGKYNDLDYVPFSGVNLNYKPLSEKLISNNLTFNFLNGGNFITNLNKLNIRYVNKQLENYHPNNIIIKGLTESRLYEYEKYGEEEENIYNVNINLNEYTYINYKGDTINGVDKIISVNDFNPIIYTESANLNDVNLGGILQNDGILFKTYLEEDRLVNINNFETIIPLTEIIYKTQSINETNSDLKASYIKEYLLNITEKPKVINDIFIDRSNTKIIQNHMQLSEINSLVDLEKYGNGYYNIFKG